jgi:hypothetical protein
LYLQDVGYFCQYKWLLNFSFPWGGFGMMLNQLSIERLIKPIYCNQTAMHTGDDHMRRVCLQVDKNFVGEKMAFQDGMSISDLMDRHAAMLPYRNYKQWNNDPGYCMLGDWVLGYYHANYYELGSPNPNKYVFHFDHQIDDTLGIVYRPPGLDPATTMSNHSVESRRQSMFVIE